MVRSNPDSSRCCVYGVVDRDFDDDNEAQWNSAGCKILHLPVHEFENLLLDFDVLASLAKDTTADALRTVAYDQAVKLRWWMVHKAVLREMRQELGAGFPGDARMDGQLTSAADVAQRASRERLLDRPHGSPEPLEHADEAQRSDPSVGTTARRRPARRHLAPDLLRQGDLPASARSRARARRGAGAASEPERSRARSQPRQADRAQDERDAARPGEAHGDPTDPASQGQTLSQAARGAYLSARQGFENSAQWPLTKIRPSKAVPVLLPGSTNLKQ